MDAKFGEEGAATGEADRSIDRDAGGPRDGCILSPEDAFSLCVRDSARKTNHSQSMPTLPERVVRVARFVHENDGMSVKKRRTL